MVFLLVKDYSNFYDGMITVFGLGDFTLADFMSIKDVASSTKLSPMEGFITCIDFERYLKSGSYFGGMFKLFLLGDEVNLLNSLRW